MNVFESDLVFEFSTNFFFYLDFDENFTKKIYNFLSFSVLFVQFFLLVEMKIDFFFMKVFFHDSKHFLNYLIIFEKKKFRNFSKMFNFQSPSCFGKGQKSNFFLETSFFSIIRKRNKM